MRTDLDWLPDCANVPIDVSRAARRILLDTIGCIMAGRQAPEVAAYERLCATLESGRFTFPGGPALTLLPAIVTGAMAGTWDEACEGLAAAHGRPGVPVVAALLPLAVARNAPLDELLGALVTGYETGARMGSWLRIRPGMHVDGNWPALGVAAGVARFIGLDGSGLAAAIEATACQLPVSLYLPVSAGATARNTYLAHSAWLGTNCALAVQAGVSAPDGATHHYARMFVDGAVQDPALWSSSRYLIRDAYLKPYAAVRHVHYGAEAAQQLRARLCSSGASTGSIGAIRLSIYEEATVYCGNRAPRTPIQAQFSLSFGLAAVLRFGVLDASVYRLGRFDDVELRRLEALVEISIDRVTSAAGQRRATLEIACGSTTLAQSIDTVAGDAASPLSDVQCTDKFVAYASAVLPAAARRFAALLLDGSGNAGTADLWKELGGR